VSAVEEHITGLEQRRSEFTRFFEDAEPRLRIALSAGLGQERGREAAAEALSYAWEHWERVSAMDNPIGYLFRVGQSKARPPKRRHLWAIPDPGHPEFEPKLPHALSRLSKNQRLAVVLVHAFGWSHGEVADLLGCSTPTVATHVRRALEKLQRALEVPVQ
jgi:DNA-directed RNA polymerase specialized sigma24 family protein